jgi:hypothetical protein
MHFLSIVGGLVLLLAHESNALTNYGSAGYSNNFGIAGIIASYDCKRFPLQQTVILTLEVLY